jgi:hypothetical protein
MDSLLWPFTTISPCRSLNPVESSSSLMIGIAGTVSPTLAERHCDVGGAGIALDVVMFGSKTGLNRWR